MFFRHLLGVKRLELSDSEILNFAVKENCREILIVIRTATEEEKLGRLKECDAVCVTSTNFEPPRKVKEILEGLLNDAAGSADVPRRRVEKYSKTLADGEIYQTYLEIPPPLQSFADEYLKELADFGASVTRLLRWRANRKTPHGRTPSWSEFSTDRANWKPFPLKKQIKVSSYLSESISDQVKSDVQSLVDSRAAEPLGHELYREALSLKLKNPRSSLMIAVTAVETSVKECIGRLVPEAEWLAWKAPTPPIVRILVEFLPLLAITKSKKPLPSIPEKLIDSLKVAVNQRNELTHQGKMNVSQEKLDEFLDVIHQILWYVDMYSGNLWAIEHLPHDIAKSIRKDLLG